MTIIAMAAIKRGIDKMRKLIIVLSILFLPISAARADLSLGFSYNAPGVSIGINMPAYPQLVPVPGYPVYYDPSIPYNYFFYDGMYWVLEGDNWYASTWYNGPWSLVAPDYVPLYVLRVPVRYYRSPPPYFRGWRSDAPPRWGDHWGRDWDQRHSGWDRWDHRYDPRPAPLPSYQRNYKGNRYPQQLNQQRSIENKRYQYQPHEPSSQQFYQQRQRQSGGQEQQYQGGGRQHDNRGRDR
jgi:hypothetical protein